MAVIQQVRFSIFSKDEISQLQNEVMNLEELAKRKQLAEEKITQSKLEKRGGIFAPHELEDVLPSAITRQHGNSLTSRVADSKLANSVKSTDKTSSAPFLRGNAFKEVTNDIDLLKEGQKKTTDALSLLSNFQGTAATKLLGAANKLLPVGFALSVATQVFALIESQYGKGGIWDRRKKELNSAKSLIGLERETDIIGGETLFMGNTTLVQGIANNQTSNTENLVDGQRRFVLRSNGF